MLKEMPSRNNSVLGQHRNLGWGGSLIGKTHGVAEVVLSLLVLLCLSLEFETGSFLVLRVKANPQKNGFCDTKNDDFCQRG